MFAAITSGTATLIQNLNILTMAVYATNANVNHLTTMIKQVPTADGGGQQPGEVVGGGPVSFVLSPRHTEENLVIYYCKKRGSSLYNAKKEVVTTKI